MSDPFSEHPAIDAEGRILVTENGDPEPSGRWVDRDGQIHLPPLGSGDRDGDLFVGPTGILHNEGWATDTAFTLPSDWWVQEAPVAPVVPAQAHAITDPQAWAGDATIAAATDLHGKALLPDYVGEDTRAEAFRDGTLRKQYQGDSFTTAYDAADTDTVRRATIAAGLLCDQQGAPVTGTFGYVVDPRDGSLFLFDQSEAWVTKSGDWVRLTGVDASPTMIKQALARGEQLSFVHHSTALAGQPVAGAGKLTVDQGTITRIDDESGHYKPEAEYLWQTVEWLQAQGMQVSDIDVRMVATTRDPELVLKGWKMQHTRGNQHAAQAKEAVLSELERTSAEKRIRALPANDPERLHFEARNCVRYNPDPTAIYCMGCGEDL